MDLLKVRLIFFISLILTVKPAYTNLTSIKHESKLYEVIYVEQYYIKSKDLSGLIFHILFIKYNYKLQIFEL